MENLIKIIRFETLLNIGVMIGIVALIGAVAVLQGHDSPLLLPLAAASGITAAITLLYAFALVRLLSAYAFYIQWQPFRWRWQYFVIVVLFICNVAVKASIETLHPILPTAILCIDTLALLPLIARFARHFKGTARPINEQELEALQRLQQPLGFRLRQPDTAMDHR